MKKRYVYIVLFILVVTESKSQKYVTESGSIDFFSHATIEDIKADNKKVVSIFNLATMEIVFAVPINSFQFEKTLMKEHFNEKYMESDKYPKSTFQGKLIGYDVAKTGLQNVKASGMLTIHGVSKEVIVPGTVEIQGS